MGIDDLIAATDRPAGAHNAAKARGMLESFEELTLRCLRLPVDKRESDSEIQLDRQIGRLSREIAALPLMSVEALRAKISSALYWLDDGDPDLWRDIASPYMDALVKCDVLLSYGVALASNYKQQLDQIHQKEIMELRRRRPSQPIDIAPT